MIRYYMLALAALFQSAAAMAQAPGLTEGVAEPSIKVVNFTAEWCPNCRVLDPRVAEAIDRFEADEIERIDLDHTGFKGADEGARIELTNAILKQTIEHDVVYLWDWFGGRTGIAVIVSADNGEPLICLNRTMSVDQIEARLRQGVTLATKAPPGLRKPNGPDCPPPMN